MLGNAEYVTTEERFRGGAAARAVAKPTERCARLEGRFRMCLAPGFCRINRRGADPIREGTPGTQTLSRLNVATRRYRKPGESRATPGHIRPQSALWLVIWGLMAPGLTDSLSAAEPPSVIGGVFTRNSPAYLGTPAGLLSYAANEPRSQTVPACSASDGAILGGEADGADLYPLSRNGRHVFGYSSQQRRLYRSADGVSWSGCGPMNDADAPFALIVIPEGPHKDRIIRFRRVSGVTSPYWSDDDGDTWTIGKSSAEPSQPFACDGNITGGWFRNWGHQYKSGGIVMAATYGSQVYRSRDDGETWERVFDRPNLLTGPVQAASSNTISLDLAAAGVNGSYVDRNIWITAGTGAGQYSRVMAYDGSTRTATVSPAWPIVPEGPGGGNPSSYAIGAFHHIHALGYHPGVGPQGRWLFNTGDKLVNQHCYVSDNDGDTWYDYLPDKTAPDGQTVGYLYDGHPTRLLLASDGNQEVGWIDLVTWEVGRYPVDWPATTYCWQVFKHDGLYYAIVGPSGIGRSGISISRDLENWVVYHRSAGASAGTFNHFCGYAGGKLHFMFHDGTNYRHFAVSPAQVVEQAGLALCAPNRNLLDPAVSQGESTAGITFSNSNAPSPLDFETRHFGTASLHLRGSNGASPRMWLTFANTSDRTRTYQARFWAKSQGLYLWTLWSGLSTYGLGTGPEAWREQISTAVTLSPGSSRTLDIGVSPSLAGGASEAWVDSLQIQEIPLTDWHPGGVERDPEVLDHTVMFTADWTHVFSVQMRDYSDDLTRDRHYLMSYVIDENHFAEVYWDGQDSCFKLQVTEDGVAGAPVATQPCWFFPKAHIKVAVRRSDGGLRLSVANGGPYEHVGSYAPDSPNQPLVGLGVIRTGKSDGSAIAPCILIDSVYTDSVASDSELNARALLATEPDPVTPPEITDQPDSQTTCPSGTVMFSVSATGQGKLTYRWQKDKRNLGENGHYSGVETATMTISGADVNDMGAYRCVISNGKGATASVVASLVLKATAAITRQPGNSYDAVPGGTATFSLTAAGTGPLAYRWQKGGVDLTDDDHVRGAATDTLQIVGVGANDADVYRCVVTDECGPVTSNEAILSLDPAPSIIPTDLDRDGDVDGNDFLVFEQCHTGPNVGPPRESCAGADFDHDNDVDQSDFGILQQCFGAPGAPSTANCVE